MTKIPGAGTSVNINKYSVMDYSPKLGDSYYRLEQFDFNGVTTYSDVRIVHLDFEPIMAFAISPNPVGAILDVELSQAEDGFIFIYNIQGKILYQYKMSKLNSSYQLNIDKLVSDAYWLHIVSFGKNVTQRFIKM